MNHDEGIELVAKPKENAVVAKLESKVRELERTLQNERDEFLS